MKIVNVLNLRKFLRFGPILKKNEQNHYPPLSKVEDHTNFVKFFTFEQKLKITSQIKLPVFSSSLEF